jgi:tRNA threonylcarbamoyladenosine modification (KEOPS) complex  Pcc1 subunit
MDVSCEISIEFDDLKKAKTVLKSIQVDNFDFVKSKINNNRLESEIKAKSISSLIHTLDDYLACISVAMKIVGKNK